MENITLDNNENKTNENKTNENKTNENKTNENKTNENKTNENKNIENKEILEDWKNVYAKEIEELWNYHCNHGIGMCQTCPTCRDRYKNRCDCAKKKYYDMLTYESFQTKLNEKKIYDKKVKELEKQFAKILN